jgi:hypothetical protein
MFRVAARFGLLESLKLQSKNDNSGTFDRLLEGS